MNFFKKIQLWFEKHVFRQHFERVALFWTTLLIVVFQLIVALILLPTIFSGLNEYEKIEGAGEYSETRVFLESRRIKFGTKIDHVTRLVLKLKEYDEEFTIGPDYSGHWNEIKSEAIKKSHFVVYLRPDYPLVNPMQIEANGEVLLSLSFHKKISWYAIIFLEVFSLLALLFFRKMFRQYKTKHYSKDILKWKSGAKGKLKVIWSFFWS